MNGISLLLLATTVGMDFGWQPASDNPNMLEYIVQLSPEEMQLLNTGKEELFSGIPRELKGRIDRVVIRMGREKLPQTPSLEQLRMTASVAGNPSILQAGGSNQGTPVLPSSPPIGTAPPASPTGFSTIDPPKILPSTPLNTAGSAPALASPTASSGNGTGSYDMLGSGVYEDLLKNQASAAPTAGAIGNSAVPASPSTFSNAPASTPGASGGSLLPSNGANPSPPATSPFSTAAAGPPASSAQIFPRDPAPPAMNATAQNSFPSTSANPNNLANNGWASVNPGANAANAAKGPPQGAAFNNFANGNMGNSPQIFPTGSVQGNNPLPNNNVAFNNNPQAQPYSSGSNNPAVNNNPPMYNNPSSPPLNSGWGPPPLVNGNNTSLVSDRGPVAGGGLLQNGDPDKSLSDKVTAETNKTDVATAELKRSGWENILQVLFLLSIVVNFYLGVLMHKLVLRYRTLLASVRTSTLAT